jgi:hypothetical protein
MLRQMRSVWNDFNRARRELIKKELAAAQARQAEVTAYWNRHKVTVKERWDRRTGGRGETTVADIPEVAAQWHRDNLVLPENVLATAQRRGEVSPHLWQCPLGLDHEPWPAWPKDRIQKGAGVPRVPPLDPARGPSGPGRPVPRTETSERHHPRCTRERAVDLPNMGRRSKYRSVGAS